MKVCVIGGLGLIGNGVYSVLSRISGMKLFFTYSKTLHSNLEKYDDDCYVYFDYRDKNSLNNIFEIKPDIIINCAGITKHIIDRFDKKDVYLINSDLPIYLDSVTKIKNFKFIQISTDCVFRGNKGNYSEKDTPDALDLYGNSKIQGEKLFYDIIYNPKETEFLRTGKRLGNKTENGKKMFIYQAAAAFKIWHGTQPEINEKVSNILD